jgi:hypothetical protein
MDYSALLGEAVTVLFVLMAYSYLIRDNILFSFVQSTYVGLGIGHALVMVVKYFRENTFPSIASGNLLLLVPLLAGLLLFGRLKRETLYLYRMPLAIVIGAGLGIQIRGMLKASLIDQLTATMNIKLTADASGINSVLVLIFVVSAMTYFFFTMQGRQNRASPLGNLRNRIMFLGQLVLMGSFGAGFAGSFIGRLAVFMGVLEQVIRFIPKILGIA